MWRKKTLISIFIALVWCALLAFFILDQQVSLARLRVKIPLVEKQVDELHEENMQLLYDIERFESPEHLMELAQQPRFSHLHYPSTDEVIILP